MNNIKLLDYFAGQALIALTFLDHPIDRNDDNYSEYTRRLARTSYDIAIAMVVERLSVMDKETILSELKESIDK